MEAVAWVMKTLRTRPDLDLSPQAKLVLIIVADYCDPDTAKAWPSVGTLATRTGFHPDTVRKALAFLESEDVGLIKREQRFRASDGGRTSDTIIPMMDQTPPLRNTGEGGGIETTGGLPSKPEGKNLPIEPKASRRKPSRPIPEGFPGEAEVAMAKDMARAEGKKLEVLREAESFRLHAAQTDRRCADWKAAFRNWILKALAKAPADPLVQEGLAPEAKANPWDRRVAAFKVSRHWDADAWGPRPGREGCMAPADILAAHGFEPVGTLL